MWAATGRDGGLAGSWDGGGLGGMAGLVGWCREAHPGVRVRGAPSGQHLLTQNRAEAGLSLLSQTPHRLQAQGSPQHISPCFSEFKRLPSILPSAHKKHSLTFFFSYLYLSRIFLPLASDSVLTPRPTAINTPVDRGQTHLLNGFVKP